MSMNFHFMSEYEKAFIPRVIKDLILNLATYDDSHVVIFEGWYQNVSEADIEKIHSLRPGTQNDRIKLGAYVYTYIKDVVLWTETQDSSTFSFELKLKVLTDCAFSLVHSIGRAERHRAINEHVLLMASAPVGKYFGYTTVDNQSGFLIITRTESEVLKVNVDVDILKVNGSDTVTQSP